MMIDAYTHAMPSRYRDELLKLGIQEHYFVPPYLADMEDRKALMEQHPGLSSVLTPMQLPLSRDLPDSVFEDLARIYNDGMAEMGAKYPEIVSAVVATVPIHNIDSAMKEAERAVKELGMKGILLPCNCQGIEPSSPEVMPLIEMMAQFDLPVWMHPWPVASSRPFVPNSGGWEMLADTADAMIHLACSGIFEKYPNAKFVAHHGGSYIPFFHTRLKSQYFWDMGAQGHMYDPAFVEPDHTVPFMYYENLKKFYVDTAYYHHCTPQIRACVEYFGADHVMFGTDFPLPSGRELAPNIESIQQLDLAPEKKELIFHGNIERILGL